MIDRCYSNELLGQALSAVNPPRLSSPRMANAVSIDPPLGGPQGKARRWRARAGLLLVWLTRFDQGARPASVRQEFRGSDAWLAARHQELTADSNPGTGRSDSRPRLTLPPAMTDVLIGATQIGTNQEAHFL